MGVGCTFLSSSAIIKHGPHLQILNNHQQKTSYGKPNIAIIVDLCTISVQRWGLGMIRAGGSLPSGIKVYDERSIPVCDLEFEGFLIDFYNL